MGFPHKPHPKETVVLSQYFGDADARTYKGWTKRGGYQALAQALKTDPVAVTDIVKESGLRGRGGAGLSKGLKWAFLAEEKKKAPQLLGDAGQGGAGTLKDPQNPRSTPPALDSLACRRRSTTSRRWRRCRTSSRAARPGIRASVSRIRRARAPSCFPCAVTCSGPAITK